MARHGKARDLEPRDGPDPTSMWLPQLFFSILSEEILMVIKAQSVAALEARARRAARRAGLIARKSRKGLGTIDNDGGFMLIDGSSNFVVFGGRFDLTPEDVISFCKD